MQWTIQVVITTDEGQTETRELACLERQDLTPTTLGLTLAEGKAVLKALQEVVVEGQLTAHLGPHRACPHCGQLRHSKGYHATHLRTVFGTIPINSPRQCPCQSQATKTVSPLAHLFPDHLTPELLFLETKWAALVSYGMTAQLLQEVLPMDEPLAACTIESTVNQVISKRFCKKQQMQWTQRGAHLLLQIRTRVLKGDWESTFREWYPGFRASLQQMAA